MRYGMANLSVRASLAVALASCPCVHVHSCGMKNFIIVLIMRLIFIIMFNGNGHPLARRMQEARTGNYILIWSGLSVQFSVIPPCHRFEATHFGRCWGHSQPCQWAVCCITSRPVMPRKKIFSSGWITSGHLPGARTHTHTHARTDNYNFSTMIILHDMPSSYLE